jgi:hypothetical protein
MLDRSWVVVAGEDVLKGAATLGITTFSIAIKYDTTSDTQHSKPCAECRYTKCYYANRSGVIKAAYYA